jgi:hypothetical protein
VYRVTDLLLILFFSSIPLLCQKELGMVHLISILLLSASVLLLGRADVRRAMLLVGEEMRGIHRISLHCFC